MKITYQSHQRNIYTVKFSRAVSQLSRRESKNLTSTVTDFTSGVTETKRVLPLFYLLSISFRKLCEVFVFLSVSRVRSFVVFRFRSESENIHRLDI